MPGIAEGEPALGELLRRAQVVRMPGPIERYVDADLCDEVVATIVAVVDGHHREAPMSPGLPEAEVASKLALPERPLVDLAVERALTAVILTSLPISLYGILQRYHLDPLPWGGDTVNRVTGNMGNAIFIGAYLIMSTFAALGRVVTYFRAILTAP